MADSELRKAIRTCLDCGKDLAEVPPWNIRFNEVRGAFEAAAARLEEQLKLCAESGSPSRLIIVGIDYGKQAQWALQEAIKLADGINGRVSLLRVIDTRVAQMSDGMFVDPTPMSEVVQSSRESLQKLMEWVPEQLRGDVLIRDGDPATEIVAAARELKADLLAIGTHSRGIIGRLLLGSVATSVVRHAACPVVTVGSAPKSSATPRAFEKAQPTKDPYAVSGT